MEYFALVKTKKIDCLLHVNVVGQTKTCNIVALTACSLYKNLRQK